MPKDYMPEGGKGILGWVLLVAIIAFILIILFLIINLIPSDSILDTSESQQKDFLYLSPESYPSITTALNSVSVFNQTWLEFDGVNDRVEIGDLVNYETESFTILVWAKSNIASGTQHLINKRTNNNGYILYQTGTGVACFVGNGTNNAQASNGGIIDEGNYHLWSCNYDGSTIQLMKDGSQTGIDKSINNINYTTGNLQFGRQADGSSYWNGSIDEVKIYNISRNINSNLNIYKSSSRGGNLGKGIPQLTYHKIDNPASSTNDVNTTEFANQMAFLNSSGFTTITYKDYLNIRNNLLEMPKKPIILVFDDGLISVFTNATIEMDKYGYVGVISIITEDIGNPANMNWTEIENLSLRGWELASHSINITSDIKPLDSSERIIQYNNSKNYIENNISGYSVTSWVFPGNSVNFTLQEECQDFYDICSGAGYNVNTERYIYKTSNISSSEIYRIGIKNSTSLKDFKKAVDIDYGLQGNWNLNENNGTTAYDNSNNAINGTITGATWNNDGITVSLTENTDYSFSSNLLTIVNSDYLFNYLSTVYQFSTSEGKLNSKKGLESIQGNYSLSLLNTSAQFPTVGTIIGIAVLLLILIGLLIFAIRKMTGIGGGFGGSKFKGSPRSFS